MKPQLEEGYLAPNETLITIEETEEAAKEFIRTKCPNDMYQGKDYAGNQVSLVGIDWFSLPCTDGKTRCAVTGYPM